VGVIAAIDFLHSVFQKMRGTIRRSGGVAVA
jgi:hypothetical protein